MFHQLTCQALLLVPTRRHPETHSSVTLLNCWNPALVGHPACCTDAILGVAATSPAYAYGLAMLVSSNTICLQLDFVTPSRSPINISIGFSIVRLVLACACQPRPQRMHRLHLT